jgi:hypothetical protein
MDNAFNYAADNTLNTEDEYPYTAKSTLAYNCKAQDAGDVRISSHSVLLLTNKRFPKLLLSTNQYQLPLKLFKLFSNYTRVELSQPTVELTLTIVPSLLDMELKTESITGKSRTHGELHGEKVDISEFSDKWESVD